MVGVYGRSRCRSLDATAESKTKKKAFLRVYGTKRPEYGPYEIGHT
jgi:hypothetical protein